jgi:hypothetical protein
MQKKKEAASEELYDELGRVFNFTRGDLEANRAGFITWRQKQIRWREVYRFLYLILFMAIPYVSIAAVVQLFEDNVEMRSSIFWVMSFFVFIMTALLLWASRLIPTSYDLGTGRVTSLVGEGRIEIRSIPKQGEIPHFVIEKLVQPFSRNSNFRLSKPCLYRVYFMPKSKRIISIEEVLQEES